MNGYDLGVLFIHGIGDQPRSDTLVRFGEPLREWFERWLTGDGANTQAASVQISNAELAPDATPAHAKLVISTSAWTSRWLLAESWWAQTFRPSQYRELWEWATLVAPWAIAVHFARKFRLAVGKPAKSVAAASFIAAIAFLPVLIMAMAGLLLLGIVPIPQLRAAILRAQQLLVGTVGDSYVYLTSSIRGAAVISKVQKDLKWLADQGCTRIAVVAHSQGAAVAHAAINDPDAVCPHLLLTFGSGLNKLLMLDQTRGDRTSALRTWILSIGLLIIGCTIGFAALSLATGAQLHTAFPESPIAWLFGLVGLNLSDVRLQVLFVAAVIYVFVFGMSFVAVEGTAVTLKWRIVASLEIALPYIAVVALPGLLFYIAGPSGVGVFSLGCLMIGTALELEVRSRTSVLFGDLDIRNRMRLKREVPWTDFYATADPVPNGPLFLWDEPSVDSRPVHNTGSIFADHSAYWPNRDEFVSRVACELGRTAGLNVADSIENGSARLERASQRRAWRVRWLRISRWIVLGSSVIWMWSLRGHALTDLSSLPRWLAAVAESIASAIAELPVIGGLVSAPSLNSAAANLLWYSSFGLAVWLTYRLVLRVWRWWEGADLAALFGRGDYDLFPASFVVLLTLLVTVVGTALAAPWFDGVIGAVSSALRAADVSEKWSAWTSILSTLAGVSGACADAFARDVFGRQGWMERTETEKRASVYFISLLKHALAAFPFAAAIVLFLHQTRWMEPLYVRAALIAAFVILGVALHFAFRWLGKRWLPDSTAGPLQMWLMRSPARTPVKGEGCPA